ncbi:MAG: transrane protease serine 12, partial [Pseudomonadota bacterium]
NSGNSGSSKINPLTSVTKPQNSLVIKNGEPVHIPELNALVPLIKVRVSGNRYQLCSGVFLAPDKILTASHCVMRLHDKEIDQYFESKDLYSPKRISIIFPKNLIRPINYRRDGSRHWSQYPVKAVYVKSDAFTGVRISNNNLTVYGHEDVNDLAIIELSRAPKYKFHIELASVAPQVNTEQIVVGFGHNTGDNAKEKGQSNGSVGIMRFGKTIVINGIRAGSNRTLRIGGSATDKAPDVVSCKGDSGGPSLSYNESSLSYTVTGITSLGYGGYACSSLPSVYMSVAYYKDWIESGYKTDSLRIGKFSKK